MSPNSDKQVASESLAWLPGFELFCLVTGLAATIIQHGLFRLSSGIHWEMGFVVIAAMTARSVSLGYRYRVNRQAKEFLLEHQVDAAIIGLWLLLSLATLIFGGLIELPGFDTWLSKFLLVTEFSITLRGVAGIVLIVRRITAGGINPTLILVLTFVVLVGIGTCLLMLPTARSEMAPTQDFATRLRIALFTATSASCVTGLAVVDTGGPQAYWSRTGQTIIMCLFQIGGLGIMTCGAFFAVAMGNQLQMRERAALRDLLESSTLGGVRKLLLAIVGFTLLSEVIGAILLSGLWADQPLGERIYYSLFHSISAFCNAGFTLTNDSLMSYGDRWQVWFAACSLIITGGLGFAVLHNVIQVLIGKLQSLRKKSALNLPGKRVRLTLASKLVLLATAGFLAFGAIGYFLLESTGPDQSKSLLTRFNEAWFQSVTFRTAGFNTVPHGEMQTATKLHAIALMFVGASPGSTGGGVKTAAIALAILALVSILKGRRHVEFLGRRIPDDQVKGALTIIVLGMIGVMKITILVVLFEPDDRNFINILFESVSAFATVGVSTGITPTLSPPSQIVIIVAMFLGRVGPLTVLMALGGRTEDARFEYPEERVILG
ncbi:MAG: Trk family potassium uptake protein [Planctomycetaceae bacterium]|nr:Trk family potassium uptake protein [Planctomycetaceae bacterium]